MVTKAKPKSVPKAKAEPKTKKIAKSAVSGKIVSKKFAEENPETTFEQTVPVVVAQPASRYYRVNDSVLEVCDGRCMRSWVENGVRCEEEVDMSLMAGAEPISDHDAFIALH